MDSWLQSSALKRELTIKALIFFIKSLLWITSAVSEPHPLFSAASAAGVVAVLYLPCHHFSILFSPVLLSTLCLLFTLLRFGSAKTPQPLPSTLPETDSKQMKHVFCEPSVEWEGWGCPLNTIYEEYDGEEEETYECSLEYSESWLHLLEGNMFEIRWEEEAEELIEIGVEEDNMFEIDLSAYA